MHNYGEARVEKKQVTIKTKATPEQIWKLWSDVDNWNSWDTQTEYSSLNGDFEVGTELIIKPAGGPKSKCKLIEVSPKKSFTVLGSLPLTKMYFIHELEKKGSETSITHSVEMKGPLTFMFSRIIGKNMEEELKEAMDNLAKMAENS
ncbi:MAG: polyketide cyclase/dehydrase and lipid transport [Acidobacteria bacterium]|nr:MAG: polyketide cyclase/dehydrase and lipid transport [Acidobacteriota bacterium]